MQVLEGHSGEVTGIAATSDGGRIYSCSYDGTLRIWDTATGTETEKLSQGSGVNCFAVCGQNRMIALGLRNGTLKIVDCVTKDVLFEDTEAHESKISSVLFSPNGSYVATGSWDMTVRVWNTRTWTTAGERLKGLGGWVSSVAFSPNGKMIASSSDDGTIRLWDGRIWICAGLSPKIGSSIWSVSFTGDGDSVVSGSLDGFVRIWNARLHTESRTKSTGILVW